MAEQAESLIVRAVFRLIDGDERVQGKYPIRRLLEVGTDLAAFGSGTLGVAALPVRPKDLPTRSQNIYVDIFILVFLVREETNIDSELELTNEFNEFRKLLTSHTPLKDADGQTSVSDDLVDFHFLRVDFAKAGVRVAFFVARYGAKIDPQSGLWAG